MGVLHPSPLHSELWLMDFDPLSFHMNSTFTYDIVSFKYQYFLYDVGFPLRS
jgi:hypothetical protein